MILSLDDELDWKFNSSKHEKISNLNENFSFIKTNLWKYWFIHNNYPDNVFYVNDYSKFESLSMDDDYSYYVKYNDNDEKIILQLPRKKINISKSRKNKLDLPSWKIKKVENINIEIKWYWKNKVYSIYSDYTEWEKPLNSIISSEYKLEEDKKIQKKYFKTQYIINNIKNTLVNYIFGDDSSR